MHTYSNKYSTWFLPLNNKQKKNYERLESLVLSFNQNFKEEVIRAKDKYNQTIRNAITEKTGLSLTTKNIVVNNKFIDSKENAAIPIKIVDIVPSSLLTLFENFDDHHIELLLHYKRLTNAYRELGFQIDNYKRFSEFHNEIYDIKTLENSQKHIHRLLQEIEASGILGAIKNLGPDLLGAYFLNNNNVELYWVSIGLCNILFDLPVEEFTIIVLTHELVHGYTHIGFDKDGHNWETEHFDNTDLRIVEGFAQLYTELICRDYFEHASKSFDVLLERQSVEYTTYKEWFREKENDIYEKTRRALLDTRNKRIFDYGAFMDNLVRIKESFDSY